MSPLYIYRCPAGHETELLRPRSVESNVCPCGADAERQAVYHFAVVGQAAIPRDEKNYRQTYGEYREAVAEVVDGYERVNKDRPPGERVQSPDYYGKARAQAIAKGAPIRA